MLIFLIGTLFRLSPVDKQKVLENSYKSPDSGAARAKPTFSSQRNHSCWSWGIKYFLPDPDGKIGIKKIFWATKFSFGAYFWTRFFIVIVTIATNNHGPKLNQNLWLPRKKKQRTSQKQMLVVIKVEWGSNSFTDQVFVGLNILLYRYFFLGPNLSLSLWP